LGSITSSFLAGSPFAQVASVEAIAVGAGGGKGCAIVIEIRPGVNRPVGQIKKQPQDASENLGLHKFPLGLAQLAAGCQGAFPLEVESKANHQIENDKHGKTEKEASPHHKPFYTHWHSGGWG